MTPAALSDRIDALVAELQQSGERLGSYINGFLN